MAILRISKPRAIAFLLAVFLIHIHAEPGASNPEHGFDLADFDGTWIQLDPGPAEDSRMTAIDEAVDGLSWIARNFAAPILRRTTAPPARIRFIWDGERLEHRVLVAGGVERARPVELGVQRDDDRDSRGEPMTAIWNWSETGLEHRWSQKQAHGQNLYRVDAEGQTLMVLQTIQVTAMSDVRPIVFESRFGRGALLEIVADPPAGETEPQP